MKKNTLYVLIMSSFTLAGCYSVSKSIQKAEPYSSQINWPEDYLTKDAEFYVHNKIQINADPQKVWNLLIQAESWPEWYPGMSNVKVLDSSVRNLHADCSFDFSTMGQNFKGQIREFEPYKRLAWETRNAKLGAYHAWLIIPNENGCLLITDEVQKGTLAKLQKIFLPNKLRKLHDVWLAEFKAKSELP
jgi:uncharacterized protein YndB with AHSA1/START domain